MSSLAGSIVGAGVSAYGQHQANKQNKQLAREQMKFQERMSSTAHQRQVADMKKAGLNPVLSATHGGASTTQGAMPQMKNVAENASNSAINFMTGLKQIQKMDAEIQNTKADTMLKTPEAKVKQGVSGLIDDTKDFWSAKALKQNVGTGKAAYKQLVEPKIHSAKKQFKTLKKSLVNKYEQAKKKFNSFFGN